MQIFDSKIYFGNDYGQLKISEFTNAKNYNDADIIIFSIYLPDYEIIIEHLYTFLGANEKERALKYYKEKDKNRFIICRSLLKFALSYYTQVDIKDIFIEILPNKKPYLPTHPDVFFNVSHSGDYAVLALSTIPIGIDLEYVDSNYPFSKILTFIFNENEIQFLNSSENQVKTFFNLWTRKESFVKALGIGIGDNFKNIPCLDGLHILNPFLTKNSKNWQVHSFEISENYLGALAYAANESITKKPIFLSMPNNIETLIKLYYPYKILL